MKIAIPKECAAGETRVAAVPATVAAYVKAEHQVHIEAGAGGGSYITDDQYRAAGAEIVADAAELFGQADIVLKIAPPGKRAGGLDEVAALRSGCVLVSLLDPLGRQELIERLAAGGVTSFALEAAPRTTRAQSMDVLSSMSTIAGYKAVLLAADALPKMMPMMMTAAGTIQPANAIIIGAGVAGLQAVATARRLGARVKAVDTRPSVKEEVESLGARFVHLEVPPHKAQTEGGYARDLGEEFYRHEQEIIAPLLKDADIVVSTALIPGRAAPLLITEAMVATMPAGAVIVDLAVAAGGNCRLTKPDQVVQAHGVKIYGPTNLPASEPVHASQMFARNVAAFVDEFVKDGQVKIDLGNEIIRAMLATHGGQVTSNKKT